MTPIMMENILKGKQTSRTLNNALAETIIGGGNGSMDSAGSGLISNPKLKQNNHDSTEQAASQYRDYGYSHIQNIQRGPTPRKQGSKKRNSRSITASAQSQSMIVQKSRPNTSLLETAYKTSYGQNQSQVVGNASSVNNQQNLINQVNIQGLKIPKKSSRLIRTLIERQNDKSAQNSRNVEGNRKLNTDIPITNNNISTSEININRNQDTVSATQSYFNNTRAMSRNEVNSTFHTNGGASGLDFINKNISPNQYKAVNAKWENQERNDYLNLSTLNEDMNNDIRLRNQHPPNTSYMRQRQQKQYKFVSEKKKAKSKATRGVGNNLLTSLFEDVYGPSTEQLARFAAKQVSQRSESEGDKTAAAQNMSQKSSHRTLQKNYLQNLGELVKIHREMKRVNCIQHPLRKTQY